MEHGRVLARGHDGIVAPAPSSAVTELALEQGVQLVLVRSRPPCLHAGEMTFAGELDRFAERFDLALLLSQAQLVDDLAGILDAWRGVYAGPGARPQAAEQLRHAGVELGVVSADAVEERSRGADQLGQLGAQLVDLEGLVGAEALHRAFRPCAPARPDLLLLVA